MNMTNEEFAKWLRGKLVEQLKKGETTTRRAADMMKTVTKMHRANNKI